jgi:hypothetical protein
MAKPAARTPSTPATPAPQLAPSEDNGVPYTERHSPGARQASKRSGSPLGLRIPEDLKARLVAASEGTDIPMSALLRRALDEKLTALGY